MTDLNDLQENQELKLDSTAIQYLASTVKWAKFLAIIGFIGVGLMVLMAFFAGTIFSTIGAMDGGMGMPDAAALGGGLLTVIYLLIAILYFVPTLYLYRFAQKTGDALNAKNQELLNEGLENQKSLFKFMGVLTIVILSLYLLVLIGAMLFAAAAAAV